MKSFLFVSLVCLVALASCAQATNPPLKIPVGITRKAAGPEAVATFAEGCFWHTEIVFQSLEGVRDAVSGYAGGTTENPSYEEVSSGRTGHAEAVNVYYDPSKISIETLVKAFFASHDPTQVNRQGVDMGPQYRSIVFYRNETEKKTIETEMKRITDSKKYSRRLATEVKSFSKFYPAEEYHQEYIFNHPDNPYVQNVSIRDYTEFRKNFREGKFKS
jgi:peptide-methionine (S)-S-oxide reductase